MTIEAYERYIERLWDAFEEADPHTVCDCLHDAASHNPSTGACLARILLSQQPCNCQMFDQRRMAI